jgi:hypothetical protein
MVQVREHPRIVWFLVTVGTVAWIIAMTLSGILSPGVLWPAFKNLSYATSAAVFVSFLLNRYFWRRRPFRYILQIPDLSGRWEGWSYRSFEGGETEWRPSAHEISQRALDITAEAWGPSNWSRSICASIVRASQGGTYELVWSYKTETVSPGPDSRPGDCHQGTHFHRYSERNGCKYLEGTYITDRIRTKDGTVGAGGFHCLVWVSHKPKHALAYDEKKWPRKPDSRSFKWNEVAPIA